MGEEHAVCRAGSLDIRFGPYSAHVDIRLLRQISKRRSTF